MSNGLGFFTIQFFTGNGTKDADAAKRIYDWCMEKYDWFCGESGDGSDAPFLLENNAFVANENVFPDGIEIKHNPALPDDLDWLSKPFKTCKAMRLVAGLRLDYSETSIDENYYIEAVWERGKERQYYSTGSFNTSISPAFVSDKCCGDLEFRKKCHIDDLGYYRLLQAKFKNRKTNEEILCGVISHNENDENEYNCKIMKGTLEIGKKQFSVIIDNQEQCAKLADNKEEAEIIKTFVSYLKKADGYSDLNESDWIFNGFSTKRSLFELYGSNPPIKDYNELSCQGSNPRVKAGKIISAIEENFLNNIKTIILTAKDLDNDDFDVNTLADSDVTINGVKKIQYHLDGCEMKSVSFSQDLEIISDCNWPNLKSIRLPKSLKEIESYAFGCCPAIEEIVYEGTIEEWNTVSVDEKAWYHGGDSSPFESILADVIQCSDGEVAIDKSLEGTYEYEYDEYEEYEEDEENYDDEGDE